MNTYKQLTPPLRARGTYTVRPPFAVVPDANYTCIAIKTFADLYNSRQDVLSTVYGVVGIQEGSTIDGSIFSLEVERLKGVNIVSLADDRGNVIYIPDNFILSYPNTTSIEYANIVLSASLGPLPNTLDLSIAQAAVRDAIQANFGVQATVNVARAPSLKQPTYEQHLVMEKARLGAITINQSSVMQVQQLQEQCKLLQDTVNTLTKILVDNNLLEAKPQP